MALYLVDRARKVARWAAKGKRFVLLSLCLDIAVSMLYCRRMSIATALVDATVDAVRETDRQLLDAMKRAVLFDTTAMQQWYDQRDYDAMRRSLMEQMPPSLRPTFKPLPAEKSTDIYFPMTTATGPYRATGTITINKDLAQGLLKAVETPMLKVGDRVKILRAMTAEEKDKTPHGWMSGMQQFVGTVGVVSGMNSYGAQVKHTSGIIYSWPLSFLELVPAAAPSVDESFGPFPSKEEAEAVNQDDADAGNDGLPLWEVKAPSGELSLVSCFPDLSDVDTYETAEDCCSLKTEKWSDAEKRYQARLLDRSGKPTERKHIALTVAAPSPSIKVTDVGMTTTVQQPATATAAEVVASVKASGSRYAGGVSLGGKPLTQEAMTAAVEAICTEFNRHSYSVAVPVDPVTGHVVGPLPVPGTRENPVKVTVYPAEPAKLRAEQERKIADALRRLPISSDLTAKPHDTDARAAERLAQAAQTAKKEQWRDFPTVEEVCAAPFNIWAFQRPDGSVFYGYFVITVSTNPAALTREYIYLQLSKEDGSVLTASAINDPFQTLRELKARTVVEMHTPVKCGACVDVGTAVAPERSIVVTTLRHSNGEPAAIIDTGTKSITVPVSRLSVFPIDTYTAASQPVKITQGQSDIAYTTAHDVAYARGTSDRPLGEVVTRTPTTTGERWVVSALPPDTDADEAADALVAAMKHEMRGNYRTNPLTSATTSATIPEQLGATMPTTEVKPTSRMRRAITEATRRAPVELGLNQAHEAIVKQAARKFKGTAAEKKVVARFLTDLLGSEYGKAGLAAALATVIPQLAPLLGKHEGKADVLAEELATRSATILAVKAGADLISLLGPLTAILSDMISSAEPQPQITAGSGRSALDEISVTAAPVAATAKR